MERILELADRARKAELANRAITIIEALDSLTQSGEPQPDRHQSISLKSGRELIEKILDARTKIDRPDLSSAWSEMALAFRSSEQAFALLGASSELPNQDELNELLNPLIGDLRSLVEGQQVPAENIDTLRMFFSALRSELVSSLAVAQERAPWRPF